MNTHNMAFFHVRHHRKEEKVVHDGKEELKWFTILNCDKAGHRETSSRGGEFLIDIWERERKGFIQVWRWWSSTTSFPSQSHTCTLHSQNGFKIPFFSASNLCTSLALTFSPLHPWSFSSRLLTARAIKWRNEKLLPCLPLFWWI